jgi:hypothetical protein
MDKMKKNMEKLGDLTDEGKSAYERMRDAHVQQLVKKLQPIQATAAAL